MGRDKILGCKLWQKCWLSAVAKPAVNVRIWFFRPQCLDASRSVICLVVLTPKSGHRSPACGHLSPGGEKRLKGWNWCACKTFARGHLVTLGRQARLYSDFCSSLGTHAHLDMQHQVCQHGCMKWDLRLYICESLGTQITVYMFGDRYMIIKKLY